MNLGAALWIGIPVLIFAVSLAVWLSANASNNIDDEDKWW